MTGHPYCSINDVKERMLIETANTDYDDALNSAVNEASDILDIFIKPYVPNATVPLSSPDNAIGEITADFGASVFKRRYLPSEVGIKGALESTGMNEIEASGWFGLGMKKLESYIRSYYILAVNVTSIYNPEIYIDLLRRGMITGKEARTLMNGTTAIYSKKIDQLTIERNETVTTTRNDTVSEYKTRRQKSFTFISGDSTTSDKYKKDSETNGSV